MFNSNRLNEIIQQVRAKQQQGGGMMMKPAEMPEMPHPTGRFQGGAMDAAPLMKPIGGRSPQIEQFPMPGQSAMHDMAREFAQQQGVQRPQGMGEMMRQMRSQRPQPQANGRRPY